MPSEDAQRIVRVVRIDRIDRIDWIDELDEVSELSTLEPPTTAAGVESEPVPPRRRWLDIAVPAALVIGTAATRLPHLSTPRAFVFDEIYYAPDAASILRNGVEQGGVVHPPGGKWLIAGGIRLALCRAGGGLPHRPADVHHGSPDRARLPHPCVGRGRRRT